MKKVFLLSVAGPLIEEEDRRPQNPSGSVYTQQGQLFAVIAMFENTEGIKKLVESMDSNNSIAAKAANAAIRKLELKDIHFENGKTLNYARLGAILRTEGRVPIYRDVTYEYDDDETEDTVETELAYVVWKMPVNEWPNIFTEQDEVDPAAWWNRPGRIIKED
jgi:hypothetical protein